MLFHLISFEENAEERCSSAIESAIKSDPSNPEAYQCLASFQVVKDQIEVSFKDFSQRLNLSYSTLQNTFISEKLKNK